MTFWNKLRAALAALMLAAASGGPALADTTLNGGQIGETITNTVLIASHVTYTTTATSYNLATVILPGGHWQCVGNVINEAAGTTFTSSIAAYGTTSATLPTAPAGGYSQVNMGASTGIGGLVTGPYNIDTDAGTTIYLVINASFTGTAPHAYGSSVCTRRG